MGKNNWFQFKQFKIIQEKAAMKVGTDALLLGAWADVSQTKNILDVGTGTGIIALMVAQRSGAKITAVEIEKNAAREAEKNVLNSPWSGRISVKNISFQEFAKESQDKYDCIVANPPFFSNNIKSAKSNLALARHNDSLSLSDLADGAAKLLSKNGNLSLILPVESALKFKKLAAEKNLFLIRLTTVSSNPKNKPHRHLLEFSKSQSQLKSSVFNIRTDNNLDYTPDYKNLTHEFYLNF